MQIITAALYYSFCADPLPNSETYMYEDNFGIYDSRRGIILYPEV
jgi:hypothetical protein